MPQNHRRPSDVYELSHLRDDFKKIAPDSTKLKKMYQRMAKVLAKQIDDPVAIHSLYHIQRGLGKVEELTDQILAILEDAITTDEDFPW